MSSETISQEQSSVLSTMSPLEKEIFELAKEILPPSLYVMGLEELGDRIFTLSKENVDHALSSIRKVKEKNAEKTSEDDWRGSILNL